MSRRGDTEQFGSLVALLRERADAESNRIAYRFLPGDEEPAHEWTYATLDTHARRIAAHLQCLGPPGARALILMPPGLDYLAAFFGCLYAGWVARADTSSSTAPSHAHVRRFRSLRTRGRTSP
jgi:acyl-CoA synthetase (AMP-forming)/AMP-acid ligase II